MLKKFRKRFFIKKEIVFLMVLVFAVSAIGVASYARHSSPIVQYSSELGTYDLSPKGEGGGRSIPASGESEPSGTWVEYCTKSGNADPRNDWEWWRKWVLDDGTDVGPWEEVRAGDGSCVPPRPDITANWNALWGQPINGGVVVQGTNPIHFGGGIRNDGPVDSGALYARVEIDNRGNQQPTYLSDVVWYGGIGTGQWAPLVPIPFYNGLVAGTYHARICGDVGGHVAESNEGNNCGDWHPFTITPPALTGLWAQCHADGKHVNLYWNAVPNATRYNPRISGSQMDQSRCTSGPNWTWSGAGGFCYTDNWPGNQVSALPVVAGANYNAWVHGVTNGIEGPAGGVNFTCPLPPPTNQSGSCSADGTLGTIRWDAPQGYDTFYTRVSTDGGNNWQVTPGSDENFKGTSKTFPTTPGQSYTWWIHSKNPINGEYSRQDVGGAFTCQNPVPGQCSTTLNTCTTGAFAEADDTTTEFKWTCSGQNGSTVSASCSAPIPGTWNTICTEGADINGNDWEWWKYFSPTSDPSIKRGWEFVRPGDGTTCRPAPPTVTKQCDTNGQAVNISWTTPPGADTTKFHPRITGLTQAQCTNSGWEWNLVTSGTNTWYECRPRNDGDWAQNSARFPVTPGVQNNFWVHAQATRSAWGDAGGTGAFTCTTPLIASCSVNPTTITAGDTATWTAIASGDTGTYTYAWTGTDILSGTTGASFSKQYTTAGPKTASVTVTSGSESKTVACTNSLTVAALPNLISTAFTVQGGSTHTMGAMLSLSARPKNSGGSTVSTPYIDRFYFQPANRTPAAAWVKISEQLGTVPLEAGVSGAVEKTSLSFATAGTYNLYHCVDQMNTIPNESNEDDNCSMTVVTIQPPPNKLPAGNFDSVTCSSVSGWAVDPDSTASLIDVHIYEYFTDGREPRLVTGGKTSVFRADVTAARTGITGLVAGNHGFSFATPENIKNNGSHTLKAFGIDANGGSPKQVGGDKVIDLSCTTPIVGVCGTANNQCISGTSVDTPPDTATQYQWTCNGQYGGANSDVCAEVKVPNLITALSIEGGVTHEANTPVTLKALVTNNGVGVVNPPYTDTFYYNLSSLMGTGTPLTLAGKALAVGGTNPESYTLTFATPGNYRIMHCVDTANQISETADADNCDTTILTITAPPQHPQVTCAPNTNSVVVDTEVVWAAAPSGGTPDPTVSTGYTYAWTGTDSLTGTTQTVRKTYGSAGQKTASVSVEDGLGLPSSPAECTVLVTDRVVRVPTADLKVKRAGAPDTAFSDTDLVINLAGGANPNIDLKWDSTNADSCTGDAYYSTGGKTSGVKRNEVPLLTSPYTRTYQVTCTNTDGGRDTDSVVVTVTPAPVVAGDPEISVDPERVRAGDSTYVSINRHGQTGCSVSAPGQPTKNDIADGVYTSDPINGETTFTLSCSSGGGTDTATVRLYPKIEEI